MAKKLFKNLTLKQKFVMYFKSRGFKEVESRTGKYQVFLCQSQNQGKGLFYFLGRSGAVRVNSRNAVKGARSHTDGFKDLLNHWSKTQDQMAWVEL